MSLSGAAVATAIAAPAVTTLRTFSLAFDRADGGRMRVLANRLAHERSFTRLRPTSSPDPLSALHSEQVEFALVPLSAIQDRSPAAAVIAGLPFGPSPPLMTGWLLHRAGYRLWSEAIEAAGLHALPVAVLPAGRCALARPLHGLGNLELHQVSAPGPTGIVWSRLGAKAARGSKPTIVDGVASGLRGFGPKAEPIALMATPRSIRLLGPSARRSPRRLLATLVTQPHAGPKTEASLPAELFVAAGAVLPSLRQALLDDPSPTVRATVAELLPLCMGDGAEITAGWPWAAGVRQTDQRMS